jgi:hypothetical protein
MKTNFTLIFLLFAFFSLFGQDPFPCGPQPVGADECQDACISCSNSQFLNAQVSSDIMTPSTTTTTWCNTVENDQYIGFVASASRVDITFTNTGCLTGSTMQAAIHGPQCSGTTQGCQSGIGVGASATITRTGLIVGGVYYLVLDGVLGSTCGIAITYARGVGYSSPTASQINGSNPAIVGKEFTYTAVSPSATSFNWRLGFKPNGSNVKLNDDPWDVSPSIVTTSDPNVRLSFDRPGTYNFCVQGENSCLRGVYKCINVVVTNPTSSFETNDLVSSFSILNNPVSQNNPLEFKINSISKFESRLKILSLDGKVLLEKNLEITAGEQTISLQDQKIIPGFYIASLSTPTGVVSNKLIVQ